MGKTKILVVEDHTIVRQGIVELLRQNPDFEIVGEAEDGGQALRLAKETPPDIIVMDISMPTMDGLSATREFKKRLPQAKVVILTIQKGEEYVYQALKNGADGYVLKEAAFDELLNAIDVVTRGKKYLSPSVSGEVIQKYVDKPRAQTSPIDTLTPKEREVLKMIAAGYRNKEMAEELFVSVKTIEFHRQNLMKKLDIHNQAALIRYAINLDLIDK